MRFTDLSLESLDSIHGTHWEGNYLIPATEELIEVTNKIRGRMGHTDLVATAADNDVYYTYYLCFCPEEKRIQLLAAISHGEKDDFANYEIDLTAEEKEMLLWKIVTQLSAEYL